MTIWDDAHVALSMTVFARGTGVESIVDCREIRLIAGVGRCAHHEAYTRGAEYRW